MNFSRLAARFPRLFPLALVLLAGLQVVTTTWHVCDLGFSPTCSEAVHHAHNGPLQSFICFCPAVARPKIPSGTPLLKTNFSHRFHGDCLAQLLQNLPGQSGAALVILDFHAPQAAFFAARPQSFVSANFSHFRGRAPPAAA